MGVACQSEVVRTRKPRDGRHQFRPQRYDMFAPALEVVSPRLIRGRLQAPEQRGKGWAFAGDAADRQIAHHLSRCDVALGQAARCDADVGDARPNRAIGELVRDIRRDELA